MASPTSRPAPSSATLEDAADTAGDWIRQHSRALAAGVAVVVVAIAGTAVYRGMSSSKASRAETAFFEAQAPLANRDLPAAERQLRQVAQRYSGTAGGTQAQLALAQILYDQGKFQDGLKVLDETDAPSVLEPSVKLLTAVGHEGLGKFADAAKLYEEVASGTSADTRKLELQATAARAYQEARDTASARRLWSAVAGRQDSQLADEARVRLGELGVRPAAGG